MTKRQAIKIALESMQREKQTLAVAANLQDVYKANLPHTLQASARRSKLLEAMQMLKELESDHHG